MITRVIINAGTLHFCKCFTDECQLTNEVDEWLTKWDLNDGCTGFTPEEVISLNAIMAEKFDDPYNVEYNAQCDENFEETLERAIAEDIERNGYDYQAMIDYAKALGINIAAI